MTIFALALMAGCASVNAARKRDEARFKSDANYATGWRDGYSICKSR
ncbi:MAG: hypothetical protein Q8R07_04805 [Candidatus Uhrbacteria bacterium]|nr:hypothetical protein [Candidatus Uhrbacteria bacterium]